MTTVRKPAKFEIRHTMPNVCVVTVPISSDQDFTVLLSADRHHDNPHCDQALEKAHLDEAVRRNAYIIDAGDLFCAMQGKYDKRSDKSSLRPEHQGGDYLDRLVKTAADFYEPYALRWLVMGRGNHETAIRSRHETDLTERLVATLNDRTGSKIQAGGYTGWVLLNFKRGMEMASRRIWYMHGYGGGGPVTKDTIQAQRQRAYIEGADVMFSGHTHDKWDMSDVKIVCNQKGIIEQRQFRYIKTGTYKEEYGTGEGGWHVETGKPPKPIGAYWVRFYYAGKKKRVRMEVTQAD